MADEKKPDSRGKPDSGDKGEAKNLIDSVMAFFKQMLGFDLNAILSLADPEIRKAAEKLAEGMKKSLPRGHWLYSNIAERAIGVLASRLETASEGQSKSIQDVVEKLTDFIDKFQSAFYGPDKVTDAKGSTQKTAEGTEKLAKVDEKFFERVFELISSTHAVDMEIVIRQLEAEAYGIADIKEALTHGRPKEPEPEVSLEEHLSAAADFVGRVVTATLTPVNKELEQHLAGVNARNAARKDAWERKKAAEPRKGTPLTKAWKWLTK